MWTVCTGTTDYGDKYTARPHTVTDDGHFVGKEVLVADTLDEIRELLPPGLTMLPRQDADDPVIVECWL